MFDVRLQETTVCFGRKFVCFVGNVGEPIRSRIVRSCLFSSSLGSRAVRNNGCILPARWKSLLLRAWM